MNEETVTVLVKAFTDIKVELEAMYLALQQRDVPRETIRAFQSEIDRETIRLEIEAKLLPALFS